MKNSILVMVRPILASSGTPLFWGRACELHRLFCFLSDFLIFIKLIQNPNLVMVRPMLASSGTPLFWVHACILLYICLIFKLFLKSTLAREKINPNDGTANFGLLRDPSFLAPGMRSSMYMFVFGVICKTYPPKIFSGVYPPKDL